MENLLKLQHFCNIVYSYVIQPASAIHLYSHLSYWEHGVLDQCAVWVCDSASASACQLSSRVVAIQFEIHA